MKTMRRKPAKHHPWKQFNPFTSKPVALVDLMGYVAESKDSKKQRRLINSSAISMMIILFATTIRADDINMKLVGYEETTDCKQKSTWKPVYDKDGNVVGYVVVSGCE